MRIELACAVCGKNRFAFPEKGGDEAIVACDDCGHVVGNMGELKQAFAEAVMTKSRKLRVRGKQADSNGR